MCDRLVRLRRPKSALAQPQTLAPALRLFLLAHNPTDPIMSTPTSISKKRKQAPATDALAGDSRFAFSAEDLAEDQDDQPQASTSTSTSKPVPGASLPAHLLPASMSGKNKPTPGLIYLSRIPPGMGPAQVKHLLGAYGEVGRVFLKRAGTFTYSDVVKRMWFIGRWVWGRVCGFRGLGCLRPWSGAGAIVAATPLGPQTPSPTPNLAPHPDPFRHTSSALWSTPLRANPR